MHRLLLWLGPALPRGVWTGIPGPWLLRDGAADVSTRQARRKRRDDPRAHRRDAMGGVGHGYKYTIAPYPSTFPWLKPVSSDQNVLRPVPLCRLRGMYSLPVRITGFRAVG
jgi:hypothetical protein